MTRTRKPIGGLVLFVLTAFLLSAAPGRAADPPDLAAQVQAAKTPADHEAIAKEYDAQAAAATQSAAMHRKMAETYKGMAATSGGKAAGVSAMPQHCATLARSFDAESEHYKAMAQTHRDLAKAP